MFNSVNPFTEETFASFAFEEEVSINTKLEKAQEAFKEWKKSNFRERAALFMRLQVLLENNATMLGNLAAQEMGKLASHAKAEVLKSASLCSYYAKHAEALLQPQFTRLDPSTQVCISQEPLGVILGIFPWNFPYWQILRSALPTLMSGNVMLVKPAPNVPKCSLALQALVEEAGFGGGLIQTIFADNPTIANLIQHPTIKAVSLTGSERAGSEVAALAAKAIKPAVLELGGSDPLIILNDAPLTEIIDQVVFSRFQNNGQSCVAAKRFLVQNEIKADFEKLLIEKISQLSLGNPLLEGIDIGPLARKDLKETLAKQVNKSLEQGANLVYQQTQIPEKGWFYPPTILGEVKPGTPAYEEELFGPVVSVFGFSTIEEAIALANDTRFGLGASIFTRDIEAAKAMAQQIETGMVYINAIVKSDVRIPFGGIKASGFGRELGEQGLKAFTQTKSTWVKENF
jgi:succinate-semialdehyde dehydrogenase/glutarate-semialdehyde dehydrogenase